MVIRRLLLFFLIVALCCCAFAGDICSLKTEHFEIIYPSESERTASLIFKSCEEVFERVSSVVGNMGEKIFLPVVIRSDVKQLNAYYTGYPYHCIVLYDTFDSGFSTLNYKEKMLDIFEHELTHALLFNHKDKFWQIMGSLFCDAFTIQGLYVHPMFSEGLSVYAESKNGSGRLNDNFFLHKIKQAKIENKFPSWYRALGGIDFGNLRDSAYSFGGPFTGYLAKRFGEDKLSEFFSRSSHLVFSTVAGLFRKTFNVELEQAWNDFCNSIEVPEELKTPYTFWDNGNYTELQAVDNKLYALNKVNETIEVFDLQTKKILYKLNSYGASGFSVASDGSLILGVVGETASYVLSVSESGTVIEKFSDYYEGIKFNDILFLVRNSGNNGFIDVYRNNSLIKTIELGYCCDVSHFSVFDSDSISFILTENGQSFIALLDTESYGIKVLDNERNLKFKTISKDTFSWAVQGQSSAMIRYGRVVPDGNSYRIELSEDDFSGGAFYPVICNDEVYFISGFAEESRLSYYPIQKNLKISEVPMHEFVACRIQDELYVSGVKAQKFNSFPYFFRGTFIPLATYSDDYIDAVGLGFTYITQDPFEWWNSVLSGGYSFSEKSFFAGLNFTEKLGKNFYFRQQGQYRYNNDKDFNLASGELALEYVTDSIAGSQFKVSAFVKPVYDRKYDFKVGGRTSFSAVKSCGTGPYDYAGFSLGAEGMYGIEERKELELEAELSFHIPHILNTGFVNNRFTVNLPATISLDYEYKKEGSVKISVLPFAMEIQNGIRCLGLFFNRFATISAYEGKYDFNRCKLDNILSGGVQLTFTPTLGMAAGNIFGILNFTLECINLDELKGKVSFKLSY